MRHKQEFYANRVSKFGKAQSWAGRFFSLQNFSDLNILMTSLVLRSQKNTTHTVHVSHLFSQGHFSFASQLQLHGTQRISLNSSTWSVESAPIVVPTKVPVGIPVLLPISDIQNIILLVTKTHNTLEIS